MNVTDDDAILKLKDYKRDVQKELEITEIILENLKVSQERTDEIMLQYFGRLEQKRLTKYL